MAHAGIVVPASLGFENPEGVPTRALCVDPWYCSQILNGTKTWELRGQNTRCRSRVAIAARGTGQLWGEVTIESSQLVAHKDDDGLHCPVPGNEAAFPGLAERFANHRVRDLSVLPYATLWAWGLASAVWYETPKSYNHPRGPISWIRLDAGAPPAHCRGDSARAPLALKDKSPDGSRRTAPKVKPAAVEQAHRRPASKRSHMSIGKGKGHGQKPRQRSSSTPEKDGLELGPKASKALAAWKHDDIEQTAAALANFRTDYAAGVATAAALSAIVKKVPATLRRGQLPFKLGRARLPENVEDVLDRLAAILDVSLKFRAEPGPKLPRAAEPSSRKRPLVASEPAGKAEKLRHADDSARAKTHFQSKPDWTQLWSLAELEKFEQLAAAQMTAADTAVLTVDEKLALTEELPREVRALVWERCGLRPTASDLILRENASRLRDHTLAIVKEARLAWVETAVRMDAQLAESVPARTSCVKMPLELTLSDQEEASVADGSPFQAWPAKDVRFFSAELNDMLLTVDDDKNRFSLAALIAVLDNVPAKILEIGGLLQVRNNLKSMVRLPRRDKLLAILDYMQDLAAKASSVHSVQQLAEEESLVCSPDFHGDDHRPTATAVAEEESLDYSPDLPEDDA